MIFVFLSSRILRFRIDWFSRSYRCGTALLWDKHTKIGGKRHWGEIEIELRKRYIVLTFCMYSCYDFIVFYRIIWILEMVWMKYKILVVDDDIFIWRIVEYNGGQVARRKLCLFFKRTDRFFSMENPIGGYSAFSLSTFNPFKFIPACSSTCLA